MKKHFIYGAIIALVLLAQGAKAELPESQSFSECIESNFYIKGALRLIVDPTLLRKPDDAFALYDDFSFSIGFDVSYLITQMGYSEGYDQSGNEIIKVYRWLEGTNRHFSKAYDAKTKMVNLTWVEEVEEQIDELKKKYPAVKGTQCIPPAPGPGTRVGG